MLQVGDGICFLVEDLSPNKYSQETQMQHNVFSVNKFMGRFFTAPRFFFKYMLSANENYPNDDFI